MSAVDEQTGRAAVERLVDGITSDHRRAGVLPKVVAAEKFARETVEHVAKLTEERAQQPPQPKPTKPQPAGATFTERNDEITDFVRPAGTFDYDKSTGEFTARGPNLLKQEAVPTNPEELRDYVARERRLKLLCSLPDWQKKIHDAFFEGAGMEFMRLRATGMFTVQELIAVGGPAWKRMKTAAADRVLDVIEDSVRVFGDWRAPNAPQAAPTERANPFPKRRKPRGI